MSTRAKIPVKKHSISMSFGDAQCLNKIQDVLWEYGFRATFTDALMVAVRLVNLSDVESIIAAYNTRKMEDGRKA